MVHEEFCDKCGFEMSLHDFEADAFDDGELIPICPDIMDLVRQGI